MIRLVYQWGPYRKGGEGIVAGGGTALVQAGAKLAKVAGKAALIVLGENVKHPAEFAMGLALRGYAFDARKTAETKDLGAAVVMCKDPEVAEEAAIATRAATLAHAAPTSSRSSPKIRIGSSTALTSPP